MPRLLIHLQCGCEPQGMKSLCLNLHFTCQVCVHSRSRITIRHESGQGGGSVCERG